jgi:hypothetical protein
MDKMDGLQQLVIFAAKVLNPLEEIENWEAKCHYPKILCPEKIFSYN